jgi:hypothetical protein
MSRSVVSATARPYSACWRAVSTGTYDAGAARFSRRTARIDLLRREDLAPLTLSMQQLIEGANLDVNLSGLP